MIKQRHLLNIIFLYGLMLMLLLVSVLHLNNKVNEYVKENYNKEQMEVFYND